MFFGGAPHTVRPSNSELAWVFGARFGLPLAIVDIGPR